MYMYVYFIQNYSEYYAKNNDSQWSNASAKWRLEKEFACGLVI